MQNFLSFKIYVSFFFCSCIPRYPDASVLAYHCSCSDLSSYALNNNWMGYTKIRLKLCSYSMVFHFFPLFLTWFYLFIYLFFVRNAISLLEHTLHFSKLPILMWILVLCVCACVCVYSPYFELHTFESNKNVAYSNRIEIHIIPSQSNIFGFDLFFKWNSNVFFFFHWNCLSIMLDVYPKHFLLNNWSHQLKCFHWFLTVCFL